MKFGCSLEMVNLLTSGPNFIIKQSKKYWIDFFKFVAAVGFKGVELPFNPYNSDPMAFETGRCGIPCSAAAIGAKYGSAEDFLALLKDVGIEEVCSVHMNANDAMLELAAAGRPAEDYFRLLLEMGVQAVRHAKSLKAGGLVISPSPECGWVFHYFGEDNTAAFELQTTKVLRQIAAQAAKEGIVVSLKTEYWSLFRGPKMAALLDAVPGARLCPDLAHLAIAGDPVLKVIDAHKDQIAYLRLGDTAFEDRYGNWRRINAEIPVEGPQKVFCDMGEGKVDLYGALKILADHDYDGWVICEQKKTLDVYRGLLKMGWFVQHELAAKL